MWHQALRRAAGLHKHPNLTSLTSAELPALTPGFVFELSTPFLLITTTAEEHVQAHLYEFIQYNLYMVYRLAQIYANYVILSLSMCYHFPHPFRALLLYLLLLRFSFDTSHLRDLTSSEKMGSCGTPLDFLY